MGYSEYSHRATSVRLLHGIAHCTGGLGLPPIHCSRARASRSLRLSVCSSLCRSPHRSYALKDSRYCGSYWYSTTREGWWAEGWTKSEAFFADRQSVYSRSMLSALHHSACRHPSPQRRVHARILYRHVPVCAWARGRPCMNAATVLWSSCVREHCRRQESRRGIPRQAVSERQTPQRISVREKQSC